MILCFFSPDSVYSQIYCTGKLLDTVQRAHIFKDSKTFVDMKLKQTPDETLEAFKSFMSKHNDEPKKEDVKEFVDVISCSI